MPTLVGAGQQLIKQVKQAKPKSTAHTVGAQDGIGRWRTVEFDAVTSKWLIPVLDAVQDPRIEKTSMNGKRLNVHFVPDIRADKRTPFDIEKAAAVLDA